MVSRWRWLTEVDSAASPTLTYTKRQVKEDGARAQPLTFYTRKAIRKPHGHGDFAACHERFKHEGATLVCECGRQKTLEYFYYCRLRLKATRQPWGTLGIQEVLSTGEGARKLDQWLGKTGYFRKFCLSLARAGGINE